MKDGPLFQGIEKIGVVSLVASTAVFTLILETSQKTVSSPSGEVISSTGFPPSVLQLSVGLVATIVALVSGAILIVDAESYFLVHETGPSQEGEEIDTEATSDDLLETRREEWEETAERLSNAERTVYEAVLEADGVLPQREIVKQTDLSKASVSRSLNSLEAKSLVEKEQRGTGNVVILR
jgi:uncharacterized membrane protein